jgi:hypothetical protein
MFTQLTSGSDYPANWGEMTPAQKREWRIYNYLNPKVDFVSPEAKKAFQIRVQRLVDVYNLKEPDRVPVTLPAGALPYTMFGVNERTAMYDYAQLAEACQKFNAQYSEELEHYAIPLVTPARVMDILEYKLYAWPGHGLPMHADVIQFVEGEYMKAEEYDDLIRDPSDFWFRTYLPRVYGVCAPFKKLYSLTDSLEINSVSHLDKLADPEVQESLLKLIEAGREFRRVKQVTDSWKDANMAHGFTANFDGAFAKAPFDTLGDTLRGTTPLMKDMYRRPDKVLEACDKIADITIKSVLSSPNITNTLKVSYPLHKGADGWMSQKQFETFYWPSFKKVMDAFINEGLIQSLFAEGSFNTRLEFVNQFPKGSVHWMFDQSDMFKAKQILGDKCSISGNVPSSLIVTGSAADVKAYCRKLIEGCGKGGGYILGPGCHAPNPKLENLRAMVQAAREYGVYRK